MTIVRLFAQARECASTGSVEVQADTVGEAVSVVAEHCDDPDRFRQVVASSKLWLNGIESAAAAPVGPSDEVAVIPPVSGGSG